MGRLSLARPAVRPKMLGRALISGPGGSGKTWTALSIAMTLAAGDISKVLVIDTEVESALTYADRFGLFGHVAWEPPYDPTELAETLDELDGTHQVVICDSISHFWRGPGGTLDLADGKFGGWKTARPAQDQLVRAILRAPAHMLLCARSKTDYAVSADGRNVTKLGLAPIQDDTFVYEVNIALDLDLEHRLTVTKSRSPAVPVGRMYPAGTQTKCAQDYADWLAGGAPPASRDDIAAIVALFDQIPDPDERATAKHLFVEAFGMPQSLTAEAIGDARTWLTQRLTATAPTGHDDQAPTPVNEPDEPDQPTEVAA